MPRGAPDFASYSVLAGISRIPDLGELGARIGGFFPYDREGTVYYYDVFPDPIFRYSHERDAVNQWAWLCATRRLWGKYSLSLASQSAVPTPQYIYIGLPPFPGGRIGIGMVAASAGISDEMYMRLFVDSEGVRHTYEMRFRVAERDISVRDQNGAWQVIEDNVGIVTGYRMWNFLKMVVDLDSHRYTRVKLNTKVIDIINISAYTTPITTPDILIPAWGMRGASTDIARVELGAIFVTTNEV